MPYFNATPARYGCIDGHATRVKYAALTGANDPIASIVTGAMTRTNNIHTRNEEGVIRWAASESLNNCAPDSLCAD
jgi:hypothetical protein